MFDSVVIGKLTFLGYGAHVIKPASSHNMAMFVVNTQDVLLKNLKIILLNVAYEIIFSKFVVETYMKVRKKNTSVMRYLLPHYSPISHSSIPQGQSLFSDAFLHFW